MGSELFERRTSRGSMARPLGAQCLAGLASIFVVSLLIGFFGSDPSRRGSSILTVAGVALITSGILLIPLLLLRTLRPPIGLALSAKGICANSLGSSFPELPWAQVQAIRLAVDQGKSVVVFDPVDPDWSPIWLGREAVRRQEGRRTALGSWLYLDPAAYGMTAEALYEEAMRFHRRFGPDAPPTYPRP